MMSDTIRIAAISAIVSISILIAIVSVLWLQRNWYRMGPGYHWDTLKVRCEEEQNGVLIGENCIKKDAVIWSAADAPK